MDQRRIHQPNDRYLQKTAQIDKSATATCW
jgi:hypothetical protein